MTRPGGRIAAAARFALLALAVASAQPGAARPERIRADHPYYSDAYREEGLVRDLVGEKNYEEVYQAYRYYQARYDSEGRVVQFREIVRGEPARTETYRYGPDGALRERIVERPDAPPEITRPGASGDEPGAVQAPP